MLTCNALFSPWGGGSYSFSDLLENMGFNLEAQGGGEGSVRVFSEFIQHIVIVGYLK